MYLCKCQEGGFVCFVWMMFPLQDKTPLTLLLFFEILDAEDVESLCVFFLYPILISKHFQEKIKLGTVFVVEYSILEYCLMNFIFALK